MDELPDGLAPFLVEFIPLLAEFLVDAVVVTATLHLAASVVYGWKTAFRAALIGSTVAVVHVAVGTYVSALLATLLAVAVDYGAIARCYDLDRERAIALTTAHLLAIGLLYLGSELLLQSQ